MVFNIYNIAAEKVVASASSKIIEKLSTKYTSFIDVLIKLLHTIEGVYCLVILINNEIYAMRDSYGVKPLCIGKRPYGGYCISSESISLQDYELIRDINAGEIIKINKNNYETLYQKSSEKISFCSFEYIYFMRNQSIINNTHISNLRFNS